MKQLLKTISLFIGIALIAFVITTYLSKAVRATGEISETTNSSGDFIGQKLEAELNILENLKNNLNGALFKDEAFKSLKDWSREIPKEDKQRNNPFAPIGQ